MVSAQPPGVGAALANSESSQRDTDTQGWPMVTGDQRDVIEFLQAASTHGGAVVERIDTHAPIVFLAGERAWRLKRAVR